VKMVLSGSMEPIIHKGAILFITPSDEYKVGDVVTFTRVGNKVPITHRIIDVRVDNDKVFYKTKGDANEEPDIQEISKINIVGKVMGWESGGVHRPFSIPYIGYALNAVKQPTGFAIIIVVPATILIYSEILNIKKELARIIEERKKKKSGESEGDKKE